MGDGRANILRNVDRRQQRPLLVARRTDAPLLARGRDEHLLPAFAATNPDEALMEIAAAEKCPNRPLNNRPPANENIGNHNAILAMNI